MHIHSYVIQSRSELGSESCMFMEKGKSVHSQMFQYLLSTEILSEWKLNLDYHI